MSGLKIMNSIKSVLTVLFFGFLLFTISFEVIADDPGITKVRLIQQTDTSYLLEADVPQILLNTIKRPVLPDRFQMTNFDFTNQSGWITLKMTITTSGSSLSPEDEIVLPWLRNGIDFTAQWLDGSIYKGLFNRSLNGIHIPLAEVMPKHKTTQEVLEESFLQGLKHFGFRFIHVLLVFILVIRIPNYTVLKYLLWYSFGQATSMIMVELGIAGIDLLYSELLLLIVVFVFAYSLAYNKPFRFAGYALFVSGLIHGISFLHELEGDHLEPVQRIQSLFAFNMAIDLVQYLLTLFLLVILPRLKGIWKQEKRIGIALGSISIFLLLLIYQKNISLGITQILDFRSSKSATSINIPVAGNVSTRQVQRGAGIMTTPFMLFLSVEPYEVRQEILMEAREVLRVFDPGYSDDFIPVAMQEELNTKISRKILENTAVRVNDTNIQPGELNVHFVHLSRGGVSIREKPIEESVQEGILGITIIYDIETLPDSIDVNWEFFTDTVRLVEASVVDAHGAFTRVLSPEDHDVQWENRLSGYRVPVIEAITVEKYAAPLVSLLLILVIALYVLIGLAQGKRIRFKRAGRLVLILAFILYPFIRTSSSIPFATQWKPSKERTGILLNDLLTNVYRAFDRRHEDAVYDRLALSVTGDQLTDIYLQNRQVMALENRGGARAKVDEVNILDVSTVEYSDDQALVADATWTVRGSVNHFGHTHYRQNQYRALVSFVNEDEVWKISSIEPIEEIRLY